MPATSPKDLHTRLMRARIYRFRDVPIGNVFFFAYLPGGFRSGLPWIKISARCYKDYPEQEHKYHIGSINAQVQGTGRKPNESDRLFT